MEKEIFEKSDESVAGAVSKIVSDLQTLVRKEVELARVELKQEWEEAKSAAFFYATGWGLFVLSAVLLIGTMVFLLASLGLALWASLLVFSVFSVIGAFAAWERAKKLGKGVDPIPRETLKNVKENIRWIQQRRT